jgi:Tol biopolymer transport system component
VNGIVCIGFCIVIVLLLSTGVQGGSSDPAISADGRYVTFDSLASNLVPGDTNGMYDIFVRDRTAGTTTRVSKSSAGVEGNDYSDSPSISADGRYVAFESLATNLVSGDTNGAYDIFVRDRTAGTTTLVSKNSAGVEGDSGSYSASISADGRYVTFQSSATNLVSGDTNGMGDIFVRDRQTGTTYLVSRDSAGVEGNGYSDSPSISADGRYVAFYSGSTNLVTGDSNGYNDIFVRDRQTGTTTRVSKSSAGVEGDGHSSNPSISSDGRYVTFESMATNLVSGDTNGKRDIFVRDRQTGTTYLVSRNSAGVEGDGQSYNPSISADGGYVTFDSGSTNLVSGDTNEAWDIFVRDRQTGTTTQVSRNSAGVEGDGSSFYPSISADGRYVKFESTATNLVPGDTNGYNDIFVRDRQTGTTTSVTVTEPPAQTTYKVYAEVGDISWGLDSANNFFNKISGIDRSGIKWEVSDTPDGEGVVTGENAHVSHWTTHPEQWIGNADFVFFTGHGNYNGVFAFPDGQANVFIYGLNKTGKVKWAAFDSCRTLHDDYTFWLDNPFLKSFDNGLHMLLGYDTDVGNNSDYPNGQFKGEIFAHLMKGDYWNSSSTMTISDAWYWSGVYSHLRYSGQGPVRSAVIYAGNCGDEKLPGYGGPSNCLGSGFTEMTRDVFPDYEQDGMNARILNLAFDNYSLTASVPVASDKAYIYTLVKTGYTKEWVSSLAKSLGMSGNISDTEDIFYADDTDAKQFYFVVQKNTSMISFQKLNRNSDIVQSETRSQSAADTSLRNYNLIPSEYLKTTVANNSAVKISPTGERQVVSKTNVIWYPQSINGLPVFGARSMVEVDSDGNIITLFKNWREYEPSQKISLKSPEDAFKEFRTHQFESSQGIPEKVNITRISLGYQIQESGNLAEYLEPVYIFEGYNQNGDIHEGFNPVIIKAGLNDLSIVT